MIIDWLVMDWLDCSWKNAIMSTNRTLELENDVL